MDTISEDIKLSFQKENQMTIEEAMTHVKNWIKDGNFESAESGIAELEKFVPGLAEVTDLKVAMRDAKAKNAEASIDKSVKKTDSLPDPSMPSKSERFLSGIGYFGFAAVLPLVLKRDSDFCKYHGKQGLMLAIVFTIMKPFSILMPGGLGLMSILYLCISIFAFIQANGGKLWNMPLFGDLARNLPLE